MALLGPLRSAPGEAPRHTSNKERCRDLLFAFIRDGSALLLSATATLGESSLEMMAQVSGATLGACCLPWEFRLQLVFHMSCFVGDGEEAAGEGEKRCWDLLFAVCCLLFAVCCLLFAVCCLLFAVIRDGPALLLSEHQTWTSALHPVGVGKHRPWPAGLPLQAFPFCNVLLLP